MLQMRSDDAAFLRREREGVARSRGTLRVVDLFTGCGGLTLGVEEAARQFGLEVNVRLAVELDARASATYAANFDVPLDRTREDVTRCFGGRLRMPLSVTESSLVELVGSKLDLLVGGPPCQGHSTLNNHTRGDDPKNSLYLRMIRAAEVLSPTAIVIENVPAIERDRGGVVERAARALERLRYSVTTGIVSVAEIGVAQARKRHVLLAIRGHEPSLEAAIAAARVTGPRDLAWAIADLKGVAESRLDRAAVLTKENAKRARWYQSHPNKFNLPNSQRPPCQRGPHKYLSMYGRLRWDRPAQTITTGFGSPGQGRYLHPDEPRTLTPHEAARIQFFPDWFDFSHLPHARDLARAIGNAVPPKLGFVLAHHVLHLTHGRVAQQAVSGSRATRTQMASVG